MAVVLSSDENGYFSSSDLRRSYSQPNFVTQHQAFHASASSSSQSNFYPAKTYEKSPPSSAESSPRTIHLESTDLSCSSTPASTFSLPPSDCDESVGLGPAQNDEQIILPQYDDAGFYNQLEDLEPPPSPGTGDSYAPSPNEHEQETPTSTSRPESPSPLERAEDDIALRAQPSRHVDYLSHNWKEEEIWSSWKLIVSRRGDYSESARLENASWRTWMKSKYKLRTVSPETLNWLKDCDVTWLYGPLQSGNASLGASRADLKPSRLSSSSSSIKKPILKKRSMSELMLQRSLSTSSLVKQAAAAVQAQQNGVTGRRPALARATTDSTAFPFSARGDNNTNLLVQSAASSSIASPSSERRRIHFNEQVEQCIAVEIRGDDDDEDVDANRFTYDSDSDDGAIMMKKTIPKKRRPILKRTKSNNSNEESKTIAMLPSTTLKYREDTPEPTETAMKHSTAMYGSPVISPSSSQETLRPSKPSGKLFIADDDDDDDDDTQDDGRTLGWRSPTKFGEGSSGLHRSPSSGSIGAEPAGMRRTASGMLMPYEEGEPTSTHEGVFGRVIDTVNTARDIAHVIWNVGWRK